MEAELNHAAGYLNNVCYVLHCVTEEKNMSLFPLDIKT